MKILIIFSIIIIMIFYIGKNVFYSAKRNLFKDHASWSGKDIKIKRLNSEETSKSKGNDNYLKMIAEESNDYLEDHFKEKGYDTK